MLVVAWRSCLLVSGQLVPLLLWELCSGPLPPAEQLESRQALAKQFAQLLDFVLRFDELKMSTPALQNDFSFYRRVMSRRSIAFGLGLGLDASVRAPLFVPRADSWNCLSGDEAIRAHFRREACKSRWRLRSTKRT